MMMVVILLAPVQWYFKNSNRPKTQCNDYRSRTIAQKVLKILTLGLPRGPKVYQGLPLYVL